MELDEGRKVTNVDTGHHLGQGLGLRGKAYGGNIGSGAKILATTKKLQKKEADLTKNDSEKHTNVLATQSFNQQQHDKLKQRFNSVKSSSASQHKSSIPIQKKVVSAHKVSPYAPKPKQPPKSKTAYSTASVLHKYKPVETGKLKNKLLSPYYNKRV
jgi:hypothetical protein